jgi:hypothetical protein
MDALVQFKILITSSNLRLKILCLLLNSYNKSRKMTSSGNSTPRCWNKRRNWRNRNHLKVTKKAISRSVKTKCNIILNSLPPLHRELTTKTVYSSRKTPSCFKNTRLRRMTVHFLYASSSCKKKKTKNTKRRWKNLKILLMKRIEMRSRLTSMLWMVKLMDLIYLHSQRWCKPAWIPNSNKEWYNLPRDGTITSLTTVWQHL